MSMTSPFIWLISMRSPTLKIFPAKMAMRPAIESSGSRNATATPAPTSPAKVPACWAKCAHRATTANTTGDDDNGAEGFMVAVAFCRLLYPRADHSVANAVDEPAEENRSDGPDECGRVVLAENAHGEWDASCRP